MRRLEGPELLAYDVLPEDLARRTRIVEVPFLPNGAAGMTISTVVLLREDRDRSGDRELIAHELVHVRQYAEHGVVGFLRRYVRAYVRGRWAGSDHRQAYLDIEAEVEARIEASQWRRRRSAGLR